jgi:hypothetical protein
MISNHPLRDGQGLGIHIFQLFRSIKKIKGDYMEEVVLMMDIRHIQLCYPSKPYKNKEFLFQDV